jgi:hypothetical protein
MTQGLQWTCNPATAVRPLIHSKQITVVGSDKSNYNTGK